jgi:hypothetical protein
MLLNSLNDYADFCIIGMRRTSVSPTPSDPAGSDPPDEKKPAIADGVFLL